MRSKKLLKLQLGTNESGRAWVGNSNRQSMLGSTS